MGRTLLSKQRLSAIASRSWNSPGRTTAASVLARAFALTAPLPFLYAEFPPETVAFWLLVTTFQSLVGAFNGALPTVAMQMVAYARTGSSSLGGNIEDHTQDRVSGPNWNLLSDVNRGTQRLFAVISVGWLVFAGVGGTLVVWRSMVSAQDVAQAGATWALFVTTSVIRLLAQPFIAYSIGFGEVAAVRRIEAGSWILGGLGAIVILLIHPSLVLAMLAIQAPLIVNFMQYRRLAYRLGFSTAPGPATKLAQRELWSRGWRGGLGALTATLTVYGSGFLLAQVGDGETVAAYLLGLNILAVISQVAFSPVAAAMPALASRYALGRIDDMTTIAQRVISRSMLIFVVLVLGVPPVIYLINSTLPQPVEFPGPEIWTAMCIAAMLVRHGGNHIHYYTATNEIRWHIVNPIFLALSLGPFTVLPASNIMLLILVQAAAAGLFYVPYARWLTGQYLSYELYRDLRDFIRPAAFMGLGFLVMWSSAQAIRLTDA